MSLNVVTGNTQQLLSLIHSYGEDKAYKQRQAIYTEGDSPKGFYYIKSGLVGLYKLSLNGKQRLLRIYSKNSFFGYRSLLGGESYHCTTVAFKPCHIVFFPFQDIQELHDKVPDVFRYFASFLCSELKDAELRIFRSSSVKVKHRVIDSLHYLHANHGEYEWTCREVGEFCGSETETVIRVCNELKRAGALTKAGRHWKVIDNGMLLELKNFG